jgi:hypothetical protein
MQDFNLSVLIILVESKHQLKSWRQETKVFISFFFKKHLNHNFVKVLTYIQTLTFPLRLFPKMKNLLQILKKSNVTRVYPEKIFLEVICINMYIYFKTCINGFLF